MDKQKRILLGAAIGIFIILVGLFIPVEREQIISQGTDSYRTHKPLLGKATATQTVSSHGKITGIGAILVNLRHAEKLTDIKLIISTTNGKKLAEATISSDQIKDDAFAWANFSNPITTPGSLALAWSAPEATQDNPIGIRFEDNAAKTLAITLREEVPAWRYIAESMAQNHYTPLFALALFIAGLVSALSLIPEHWQYKELSSKSLYISTLIIFVCLAAGVRLFLETRLYGVSGGDPYNYLTITQKVSQFHNPFFQEKRLPGFPLLLVPAYLTSIDDIWFMRFISILSASGVLLGIAWLAQGLKLPREVSLVAIALLIFQKDFVTTSLRPEPYTFYALLLVLALGLFFNLPKKWAQVALGLVLGYAAMTRQEGFVLALTMGICALAQWKQLWWHGYLRIGIPALLLVLPFFTYNTFAYGNPLYTPYFEGERLQIVDSWPAFVDSLGATWGVIGSIWYPLWDKLLRVPLASAMFLVPLLITTSFSIFFLRSQNRNIQIARLMIISLTAIATIVLTLYALTQPFAFFADNLAAITAGALCGSVIPFLIRTRWRGVAVLLVLIPQIIIATWFHPFPKHYQQDYPLLLLMLAATLIIPLSAVAIFQTSKKKLNIVSNGIYRTAMLIPLLVVIAILFTKTNTYFDKSNQHTALDHVVYQATQVARKLPGNYGADRFYQPTTLYLGEQAYSYEDANDKASIDVQQKWISDKNIRTIIIADTNDTLLIPDPSWKRFASFKAAGDDERIFESVVYTVK